MDELMDVYMDEWMDGLWTWNGRKHLTFPYNDWINAKQRLGNIPDDAKAMNLLYIARI